MVRRVGFDAPDPESGKPEDAGGAPSPRMSLAEKRRLRREGRFKDPLIPRDDSPRGRKRAKWIIIAFLSLWMAGWSYAIYTAFESAFRATGVGFVFMMVWIVAAGLGWSFGALLLFMLLFGKEVDKTKTKE